jgi:hypothetical protein
MFNAEGKAGRALLCRRANLAWTLTVVPPLRDCAKGSPCWVWGSSAACPQLSTTGALPAEPRFRASLLEMTAIVFGDASVALLPNIRNARLLYENGRFRKKR